MSDYVFSADEHKLSDLLKARLGSDEENEYISTMAIIACHHTGEKFPPEYYIKKAIEYAEKNNSASVRNIGDYILSLRD